MVVRGKGNFRFLKTLFPRIFIMTDFPASLGENVMGLIKINPLTALTIC